MKAFTEVKDISQLRPLRAKTAAALITAKIIKLKPQNQLNSNELQFWAEKLVLDILDYCHREDFPEALIYTCVELVLKRISDEETAEVDGESETAVLPPLSEIKMDDTTFKFYTGTIKATAAPNNVGLLSDLDFESIKPKLNLYRKVVSY